MFRLSYEKKKGLLFPLADLRQSLGYYGRETVTRSLKIS